MPVGEPASPILQRWLGNWLKRSLRKGIKSVFGNIFKFHHELVLSHSRGSSHNPVRAFGMNARNLGLVKNSYPGRLS